MACLRAMGGHKGYALAFMIEVFCASLNAAPWGPNITPMYGDYSARRHLGSFVGAIDPGRFAGGGNFADSVAALAACARSQQPIDPANPVLAPGDDQYACEKRRRTEGIPVEPGLALQIREWCARLYVAEPAGLS